MFFLFNMAHLIQMNKTKVIHFFTLTCMYNISMLIFVCINQIAGKVAAPLSKTNEIIILSGDSNRVTGEVNRLLAELPVSVNALTGVDLTKVRWKCSIYDKC